VQLINGKRGSPSFRQARTKHKPYLFLFVFQRRGSWNISMRRGSSALASWLGFSLPAPRRRKTKRIIQGHQWL